MSEDAVRAAFARQAKVSPPLGSPFNGALAGVIGERIDRSTAVGRRVLDWDGIPDSLNDALPLRLTGALHLLARRGVEPGLTAVTPPNPLPNADGLWAAVAPVLESQEALILRLLDNPPQTNETGRAGPLMTGLLTLAAKTGLPMRLFELGSSAGLNLNLARFAYDLGGVKTGDPESAVLIKPDWDGLPPPAADVRILEARGVDQSPVDAAKDGELLIAYVWPDQPDRLARVIAAVELAKANPPRVDKGDAADWLEQILTPAGARGELRVVLHTVAYQYFPPLVQQRIRDHLALVGRTAAPDAPLAWLRYEVDTDLKAMSLRLTLWPDGTERVLGVGHPHGKNFQMF